tara:strand:- start:249 stop:401 length:153 start_codon:yes stop_codon:yes gene_type:complete
MRTAERVVRKMLVDPLGRFREGVGGGGLPDFMCAADCSYFFFWERLEART